MIPMPHQIVGAQFLASRRAALLADQPRVGKTGAAIMAADLVLAKRILVVTTASGRAVWRRAFGDWSTFRRPLTLIDPANWKKQDISGVVVVSWKSCTKPEIRAFFMSQAWDVAILDECHYAKNFDTLRTQAVYGVLVDGGEGYNRNHAAIRATGRVWLLSGTPAPNSIIDIYPHLRTLHQKCLLPELKNGFPDVLSFENFRSRYAIVGYKKVGTGSFARTIPVVIRGQNEAELRARIGPDFMLRRTQKDVGIQQPIYEILPLIVKDKLRKEAEKHVNVAAILKAAEEGNTADLNLHTAKVRRAVGMAKIGALLELVTEEFECGLDKLVIAAWHTDVIANIAYCLMPYGARTITGATSEADREANAEAFRSDPTCRVLVGQIQAAGEAIDLSAAAELIFAESSTIPAQMKQMSLRITNHQQKRQTRVRVAVIDGSWDDQVETILLRKWASIRQVVT